MRKGRYETTMIMAAIYGLDLALAFRFGWDYGRDELCIG